MHHQKSHEEDAREHLFASLNREPNNELDALLRSPSDTILYTKSLPSNNFYAGTYGAAGPSTATASSPQSQALFSARTGTYTEPTTYSTSNKGKSRSKQKEVDVLSVGATKGSSADEISALTSGSDTDKSGPIALKDAGSHFEPGIAKKAVRGRKKYKVSLHHGDRKSDLNLIGKSQSHESSTNAD